VVTGEQDSVRRTFALQDTLKIGFGCILTWLPPAAFRPPPPRGVPPKRGCPGGVPGWLERGTSNPGGTEEGLEFSQKASLIPSAVLARQCGCPSGPLDPLPFAFAFPLALLCLCLCLCLSLLHFSKDPPARTGAAACGLRGRNSWEVGNADTTSGPHSSTRAKFYVTKQQHTWIPVRSRTPKHTSTAIGQDGCARQGERRRRVAGDRFSKDPPALPELETLHGITLL
jgi:hypothetical protein